MRPQRSADEFRRKRKKRRRKLEPSETDASMQRTSEPFPVATKAKTTETTSWLCLISSSVLLVLAALSGCGCSMPALKPITAGRAAPHNQNGLIASAQPHLEAPFRRLNKRHNTFAAADASPEVEFDAGSGPMDSSAANAVASVAAIDHFVASNERRPLQIVRLFAPEAVQSQHENVTLDCMFKFDKKLDQRLTVKWYLNDELEPIYQWIPELNKRVYSDKYERYIDKSYAVSDDVDFMLGAYRMLENANPPQAALAKTTSRKLSDQLSPLAQEIAGDDPSPYERRALAERLDALARLGGVRARQLIGQVRAALALEQYPDSSSASAASYSSPLSSASASKEQQVNDDAANNNNYEQLQSTPDAFKSFRAIRLVRPTSELSGRYTCSVSSLDSDAIASTRLLVYEPARSFTFNVTRAPNNQYNLTCRAGPTFPRPTLSLFRYRAGPIETAGTHSSNDFALPASGGHAHSEVTQARPRGLASTQLRQEPLVGLQTQITVSAKQLPPPTNLLEPSNEIAPDPSTYLSNEHQQPGADAQQVNARNGYSNPIAGSSSSSAFDIVAWALVDESSLSFNLATQFECVLNIEGATNYERRQSLALQRGWHLSQPASGSAALVARSTLIGVLSAIASLLCLTLALVSTLVAFKLMRRYASRRARVHSGPTATGARFSGGSGGGGSGAAGTGTLASISARGEPVEPASTKKQLDATGSEPTDPNNNNNNSNGRCWSTFWQQPASKQKQLERNQDQKDCSSSTDGHCSTSSTVGEAPAEQKACPLGSPGAVTEPEGVYRVPGESGLAFASRLVIGGGGGSAGAGNRWQMPPCNGVPVYGIVGDSMARQQTNSFGLVAQQQQQQLSAAQVNAADNGLPRLIPTTAPPDRVNSGSRQVQPIQRQTIAVNGKALYC